MSYNPNKETCPHCGSSNLEAEFVDVGCGSPGVQASPYMCWDCGAREFSSEEDAIDAFDVEVACNWHMGQPELGKPDDEMIKRSAMWPLTDKQKSLCADRRASARRALKERAAREEMHKTWVEAQNEKQRIQQAYIDESLF